MLSDLVKSLEQGKDLDPHEIKLAIDALVSDEESVEVKASFLASLKIRET